MKSRRKAREAVLQALYQCDALGDWSEEVINLYFEVFHGDVVPGSIVSSSDNYRFARSLLQGAIDEMEYIDGCISKASVRWSLKRMSRVDRNILRMATYEMAFLADIPTSVSINEAIEIAKRYGTDDSPMFINGVLDNVASIVSSPAESAGSDFEEPIKKAVS